MTTTLATPAPTATTITVICAVCGRYLRTIDGEGVSGVSHGFCEPCADALLAEYERGREAVAQ
jgi:hypothetical protein